MRYLADQPILARRASAMYQLRKFIVRHRLFFIFAAASVVTVTGGRLWVDHLDAQNRAEIIRNEELLEVLAAINEYEWAHLLHDGGKFEQALPKYLSAVATFRRLELKERAGPAMVRLGSVLLQRADPADQDYGAAEGFLVDALDIFDERPMEWIPERLSALRGLQLLYGPDIWDLPDEMAEVEAEIAELDAAFRAREDAAAPPSGD